MPHFDGAFCFPLYIAFRFSPSSLPYQMAEFYTPNGSSISTQSARGKVVTLWKKIARVTAVNPVTPGWMSGGFAEANLCAAGIAACRKCSLRHVLGWRYADAKPEFRKAAHSLWRCALAGSRVSGSKLLMGKFLYRNQLEVSNSHFRAVFLRVEEALTGRLGRHSRARITPGFVALRPAPFTLISRRLQTPQADGTNTTEGKKQRTKAKS